MCKTKYEFVYDSYFKPLHQWKYCGDLINNIKYAPICVPEDKYRGTKINLRHALNVFWGICTVEYFSKITPCK